MAGTKNKILPKTEARITAQIRTYLKILGIYCWKHWQGPMSYPKGVADIIGILPDGRFLAIEVKTERGKLTENQEIFLKKIEENQGVAICARSLSDVTEFFEDKILGGK
jgi:hypothetical protein